MPRKKRNSTTITTEKTNTKAEPKPSASRSKSKSVKPKKSPARPRKTSKSTTRSKSTKRGRPSKSKAPAPVQDLSRESSVASQSPEPEKKKPGRKASSNIVEKSVGKSKKELKEEKVSAKVTKTPGRPKSKGRSVTKAKAGKSTSRAPKAAKEKEVKEKEKEMKEEVQTRSARKSRKNEKKEERTPSPDPEPPKAAMTTPKRSRKNAKESKMQVTPATEKVRTRVKASLVCKKEDTISERSEREDDHKGRSKKKEKKAAIPSRTQAKLLKKKMKKEQVDLPRFPTQEASIEGLIVEAIKGLKTKAMEDRIIGYLGKRFSDVDGGYIKNVLQKMSIDEKLLLKGLGGGSVSCGKRDFDRAGGSDSMETSMIKKVKTSRNSSPAYKNLQPRGSRKMQTEDDRSDRYERKQNLSNMEIEMVENTEVKNEDGSDASKKMEEEKAVEVTIKEEEIVPPIIIQEEEDIVLKLSASDSKKALIEYYERKLLGIRGLLTTDKKKNDVTPGMITQQGVTPNPVETPMPPGDVQTKEQQQEAKKEEQEEVRTTSVRRPELNESVEQIVSEKRNLSFDKEPLLDKKQLGSGKGKENDEKIEEDEGRGMVIWELQESSVLEKTMAGTESLKETGQENGIELLMKLLTLPGVVTPDGADDQKMEETPQPRADEEKKVLETTSGEKIEETAENKAAEVASTKTEPKVEETIEKAEEGAVAAKGGNATTAEEDSIRKKMRSAVESYLEMLQGRIDLDYSRENGENTLVSTSEEGGVLQEKDMNKGQAGNNSNNKEAGKKIEEDYVKEESDLERPQKLSVSKFLS